MIFVRWPERARATIVPRQMGIAYSCPSNHEARGAGRADVPVGFAPRGGRVRNVRCLEGGHLEALLCARAELLSEGNRCGL